MSYTNERNKVDYVMFTGFLLLFSFHGSENASLDHATLRSVADILRKKRTKVHILTFNIKWHNRNTIENVTNST